MSSISFTINESSQDQIFCHLNECDLDFIPSLSSRIDIETYSNKIRSNAVTIEAFCDDNLIGLLAVYVKKDEISDSYITNVSVVKEYWGKGIGSSLLHHCITFLQNHHIKGVTLEVNSENIVVQRFYKKSGFNIVGEKHNVIIMSRLLE
jgi:ribosomal protein S18 acetylase RimI-like enzyme